MSVRDLWLLTRKIAVGVAVSVVPLVILAGGLWLTRYVLGGGSRSQQTSAQVSHAN
jgi:uncharacterized membrane protein